MDTVVSTPPQPKHSYSKKSPQVPLFLAWLLAITFLSLTVVLLVSKFHRTGIFAAFTFMSGFFHPCCMHLQFYFFLLVAAAA